MQFRAKEVARAVGGDLQTGNLVDKGQTGDVQIDGVAIDSRVVAAGQLFVPIVAERDGHEFVPAAIAAGAAAYLTSEADIPIDGKVAAIVVDDTARALLALGEHARSRIGGRVVGITGSVGKTTVKDLTAAALATQLSVHASPRSFNNELGVPLTLANSPDGVEAVVVEMGARGRGHIAKLCAIARPTVGVVTTVALAHAEMFGTVEDVAAAKGELVEALPSSGTAVLNGDHPLVAAMAARTAARVVTFGVEGHHDVTASMITIDDDLRASFRLHSPWGDADVRLEVRGAHQVMNALAAAAAASACGVSVDAVANGLASATLSPWRMDLQRTARGALVLNDAYNANPTSMEAALRALAALPARRRIAVVGPMAELGPAGPEEHRRMAQFARDLGIELIAVGTADYGIAPVDDVDDALLELADLADLADGDAVLVKGSRVAGLEALAARLLSRAPRPRPGA
ncbi:MAG: UDP-N-acetylmuramoyl-tripeptide--D-alanyl-D-alanine ligase [Acidimicrobiaceae bacterium]